MAPGRRLYELVCQRCGKSYHPTSRRQSYCSLPCAYAGNTRPVADRLWEMIDKRGPDECWPWLGSVHGGGYGHIQVGAKHRTAHVVAWELTTGQKMPPGMMGCHKCDNRKCCNPVHIFPGTAADNFRDARNKGRLNPPRGERNGRSRLTEAQVIEIRERYAAGESQRDLARAFGLGDGYISRLVRGHFWKSALRERMA